ncbi:uncharacterized protein LOC134282312 [Saccostrea cucullata]|uniref:uncharacterized protein LOC134282312 n=1 Tax=Saccostrea cuccullata TaxID=36930 RepID=UPI002ED65C81
MFGKIIQTTVSFDNHGYSKRTAQTLPPLQERKTEAGTSPPVKVKQLLDEPETVSTIETWYFNLHSVACLSDEKIWTRGNGSTIELYSTPMATLWNSLLKSITVKSGSTSSGDLLVIMYSDDNKPTKVVRYSASTQKQTIQFDDKGKPLFSNATRFITEKKNLDICVSDSWAKAVVVVNKGGKLRFRYTGYTPAPKNKTFCPRGITTDSQSHILTADIENHCVHIIDRDRHFLRFIDCGLCEPIGLCTDINDNLFVAQYRNCKVKKIKYQK